MVIKTKAIVLHAFKFGENKMMIDLLTEQQGRVTFAARISNSPRAKVKKQYFQPFAVLDVEYDYRQKATIQTFIHVGIAYPLGSIPFDSYKLSISFFLAELTAYATRDEQTNAPLFNYIVSSIEWLDSCGTTFSNFHLVYIVHLLRFLGFYPNLEAYAEGCYFDMRSGCYSCTMPTHRDFLAPSDANLVATFSRMDYANMHLFKMSHADRNRFCEIVLTYYRLHIPKFPELKSLKVLRELY